MFYPWLPTQYAAHTQSVPIILFTHLTLCCCVFSYSPCLGGWTRPSSLQDTNNNFPSTSVWASQKVSYNGQLPYVTNWQMQFALCFCFIIYQISCKICVFINHKTCGSCTVAHQILYSALSTDILWTADGLGGSVDWSARSSETKTTDFWLLEFIQLWCVSVLC